MRVCACWVCRCVSVRVRECPRRVRVRVPRECVRGGVGGGARIPAVARAPVPVSPCCLAVAVSMCLDAVSMCVTCAVFAEPTATPRPRSLKAVSAATLDAGMRRLACVGWHASVGMRRLGPCAPETPTPH
eukprot:907697-Rhodomonas_salina.2